MKLGNTVYWITKTTGIHWIVKKVSKILGIDCGCDRRRSEWNKYEFKRFSNEDND